MSAEDLRWSSNVGQNCIGQLASVAPALLSGTVLAEAMSTDRSYEDEEVRAIIDRALKAEPERGVSHDDLLTIGAEVGLSRAAIEDAAREVELARLDRAAKASIIARRRRALLRHALVFLVVNAFLFTINFLTTPGEWWVLFSVFGWGLGLLLHAAFGLSAQISPRRLQRETLRLAKRQSQSPSQKEASASAERPPERRIGVRVAGPLDQIEDESDPELAAKRTSRI